MNILKNLLVAAAALCLSIGLSAQNVLVKRTVKDAVTGEALPYAGIIIKGTDQGTNSDKMENSP